MRNQKKKLKISESELKTYLLENYIDDNGTKVSDRELWSKEEFFETTGLFRINIYTGKREICSTGTISYWKNKLNLKEDVVFEYHQLFSKRIGLDVQFEEWSKKNNKGHTVKQSFSENMIKKRLIKHFGVSQVYSHLSLERALSYICEFLDGLGKDGKKEIAKFYETLGRDE